MRTPTLAGQYRRVRDTDDGCTIYSCCWCDRAVEVRDNPQYWNFCPNCGKSWFTKLQCRPTTVPRWHWDRFGDDYKYYDKVQTSGGEVEVYSLQWYSRKPKSTAVWRIECRTKWPKDEWGSWEYEYSTDKDTTKPDWMWVKSVLNGCRGRHDGNGYPGIKYEYRAPILV